MTDFLSVTYIVQNIVNLLNLSLRVETILMVEAKNKSNTSDIVCRENARKDSILKQGR